jgi:hypothetical protein
MDEVLQAARSKGFPTPIFIHRASVEAADEFFGSRAPDARAIADPDGSLFLAKLSAAAICGPKRR